MNFKIKQNDIVVCFMLLLVIMSASCIAAEPALKDIFAKDFLIGGALNGNQIYGNSPSEAIIISSHFNTVTSENILKWQGIHPEPERYNFDPADKYVELGQKNKMFIIGHVLVWHNQTPKWVFENADDTAISREALLKRMKDHIFTVVGRYKGRINGWDVVNEANADDGTLRKSKWLQIIGEDYLEKAFQYAHEADPDAELYYNDYDMWKKGRRESVIRLIKKLQAKGIHIDGIGIQGHWGFDYPPLADIEASIVACSELGVKVMITELDITVLPSAWKDRGADITKSYELQKKLNPYPEELPTKTHRQLAKRYAEIFSIFHKHADKISRVTFWGVQDGNSWRNNWPVKGRTDYPLLFDRGCKPKPAFDALIKVVQNDK